MRTLKPRRAVCRVTVVSCLLLAACGTKNTANEKRLESLPGTDLPAAEFAYVPLQGASAVAVIDLKTKKQVTRVKTDGHSIDSRITPDLTKVYVINTFNPTVSVIRAKCPDDQAAWTEQERAAGKCTPNSRLNPIQVADKGAYYFSIAKDGHHIYVASDTAINEIDTVSDKILRRIKPVSGTIAVEADPDGKRLWLAGAAGTIQAIDLQTGAVVSKIAKVDPAPATFKLSPDGKWIYTASIPTDLSKGSFNIDPTRAATVQIIDTKTMEVVKTVPMVIGTFILGLEVSTDGAQIWSANGNNHIALIDGATRSLVTKIQTDFDAAEAVETTPDGRLVLAVGHMGKLDPTRPPVDRQAYGQFYSTSTFEKVGDPIDLGKTSGGIPTISAH